MKEDAGVDWATENGVFDAGFDEGYLEGVQSATYEVIKLSLETMKVSGTSSDEVRKMTERLIDEIWGL